MKVAPGVRLSVSKRGVGASVGAGGVRYSAHSTGRKTVSARSGVPGVYYQSTKGGSQKGSASRPAAGSAPPSPAAPSKPGLFAPKGEKDLYKAIKAQDVQAIKRVGESQPDFQLPAYSLAGLMVVTDEPQESKRMLETVFATGQDPAADKFVSKYLYTEMELQRGRAGYDKYRNDFAKLIWRTASPKWNFDDATFDRSAASFDNPDHVAIVIHNYRWRLGLAEGEAEYEELEKRLAEGPVITVPAITLEGDANGAPHPEPSAYADKFAGRYSHRTIEGGIGHNLPQEAPEAFAQAVVDVAA